jgi:hypothetical protein
MKMTVRTTTTPLWNKGHLWSSLRSALSDYPILLAQVPHGAGKVVATVAVLKGGPVLRQGAFVGSHHVTTTREDQR